MTLIAREYFPDETGRNIKKKNPASSHGIRVAATLPTGGHGGYHQ
jgi:hypothetical protein